MTRPRFTKVATGTMSRAEIVLFWRQFYWRQRYTSGSPWTVALETKRLAEKGADMTLSNSAREEAMELGLWGTKLPPCSWGVPQGNGFNAGRNFNKRGRRISK